MKELSLETLRHSSIPEPLPGKNLTAPLKKSQFPVPMMFPQAKPWSSHLPFRQILMPHL